MKSRSILVVEDDDDELALLQVGIEFARVTTPMYVVRDGKQAIDYLAGTGHYSDRKKYPLPTLILLDLKLPQVPGLEVLKWLRQQAALPIPVIILTASASQLDIQECYQHGANAYLVKPVGLADLVRMLEAIKQFWLEFNKPPAQHLLQARASMLSLPPRASSERSDLPSQ